MALSTVGIAGRCGVQQPLSVLDDVMAYGGYGTTSLRSVLGTMAAESVADPDSTALLGLDATATITNQVQSLAGYDHTIHLDLTLQNLRNEWVAIDSAQLFLTDSGGYVLMAMNVYGQGAILGNSPTPILPQSTHHGTWDYDWGGGPFNFVLSVHAKTSGGERQHLLRRIPIRRDGFRAPPNISVPSPVFVGLWCRPAEIVPIWRNGAKKWLTIAGHVVNLTRGTAPIRIDKWSAKIVRKGSVLVDLQPQLSFVHVNPDNTIGKAVAPAGDGSVTLTDVRSGFVYGWEVNQLPDNLAHTVLQVELRYTQQGANAGQKGIAICAYQLMNVKPLVIQAPVKSSAPNTWWWGNAPDHIKFDAHAWSGERYCYDIVMHDGAGNTFSGDCTKNADGTHSGACTDNTSFYAYGKPIYASVAGDLALEHHDSVENSGYDANPATGAGNYVVTHQADDSMVGYFHLKPAASSPTEPITVGKQVGHLGNSGGSSEPHLHLGAATQHPTGRSIITALAFSNLKTTDGTTVTGVPGNGLYTS
jgi:hypothetical protein